MATFCLPPNCGALVLTAVRLPRSLWFTPYKETKGSNQKYIRSLTHFQPTDGAQVTLANGSQVMMTWDHSPTYHRRIAKTFDCLKDPTTYGSHRKGPTTVVHNAPGAKNRKEREKKRWAYFSFINHKTLFVNKGYKTDSRAGLTATSNIWPIKYRQRLRILNRSTSIQPKSSKLQGMELASTPYCSQHFIHSLNY